LKTKEPLKEISGLLPLILNQRSYTCLRTAELRLANDGTLRQVLYDYFAWATTTTMSRYHQSADDVPNGLSIPRWSWDGNSKCKTPRLTTGGILDLDAHHLTAAYELQTTGRLLNRWGVCDPTIS
jgi:hypothetical protein